jgi:hypothetical protein
MANRTAAAVEAQVLEVRARLEANPWAQVGARRRSRGSLRSSARSCRPSARPTRSPRATKRHRPGRRASNGIPYPAPAAKRPRAVAQVDLVGPRHLDGGVRFHALNQIDVASHHAGIEIVPDRGDQRVLGAVGPSRRVGADPVRQRWPVRLPDRAGRGRARVPARGRHAGVHPAPRAVAQRHDRILGSRSGADALM